MYSLYIGRTEYGDCIYKDGQYFNIAKISEIDKFEYINVGRHYDLGIPIYGKYISHYSLPYINNHVKFDYCKIAIYDNHPREYLNIPYYIVNLHIYADNNISDKINKIDKIFIKYEQLPDNINDALDKAKIVEFGEHIDYNILEKCNFYSNNINKIIIKKYMKPYIFDRFPNATNISTYINDEDLKYIPKNIKKLEIKTEIIFKNILDNFPNLVTFKGLCDYQEVAKYKDYIINETSITKLEINKYKIFEKELTKKKSDIRFKSIKVCK